MDIKDFPGGAVDKNLPMRLNVRAKENGLKITPKFFIRVINDILVLLLGRRNKKRKVEKMIGCVLERVSS